MAVIGTIDSVFLAPGMSANNRLYTEGLIEAAVARMQDRIADPDGLPLTMLTHHGAGDDSKEIVGRIVSVKLDPATHEASLQGYLIDSPAGKTIASAIETDDQGRRALDSMSIRGWWLGPVRTVDMDGVTCETGDDLEVDGVDFTRSPGVAKARLRSAARLVTTESASARTPIRESVEVRMSDSRLVHSTSTPSPADIPPRTPAATETAPPAPEPEAVNPLAETIAKLREARVAIGGWQGPVDLDLSAWGLSNDDVAAAATQIGAAYTAALRVLDPDNDDDLDLPGGEDVEDDPCAACGAALMSGAAFCSACGAAVDETAAPAADEIKENTMPDTKADEMAGDAAAAARKQLGLPAEEAAPVAAPAEVAAEVAAPVVAPAAETTDPAAVPAEEPVADVAPAAAAVAAPSGTVTLTQAQFDALLAGRAPAAAPVESAPAGAAAVGETAPAPVAEGTPVTDAAAFETAVRTAAEAAVDKIRTEMIEAYGPPQRKGLVEAVKRAGDEDKKLHTLSPSELNAQAAQIWNTVLGDPDLVS